MLWEPRHTAPFTSLCGCFSDAMAEGVGQGVCGPKSLKSLLCGSVREVCQPLPCSAVPTASSTGGMRWGFLKMMCLFLLNFYTMLKRIIINTQVKSNQSQETAAQFCVYELCRAGKFAERVGQWLPGAGEGRVGGGKN